MTANVYGLLIMTKGVYHITFSLALQNPLSTSETFTAAVFNNSILEETPSSAIAVAANTTASLSGELFLSLNAGDDISLQVNAGSGSYGFINSCSFTAIQLQ